jgi:hypothetical protein
MTGRVNDLQGQCSWDSQVRDGNCQFAHRPPEASPGRCSLDSKRDFSVTT